MTITLEDLVWKHYRHAHPRLSYDSAVRLHYVMRSIDRYAGRAVLTEELTENLFNEWLSSRMDEVSESTGYHNRVDLLKVWKWAHMSGLCPHPIPMAFTRISAADRHEAADRKAEGITLRQLLWDRYFPLRQNLKRKSAEQIEYSIRAFQNHVGRTILVSELCEELVMDFLMARKASASAEAVKRNASHIMTLWRFAVRKRLCDTPLPEDWEPMRIPKRIPRAWTLEEFGQLLKVAGGLTGPLSKRGTLLAADFWTALFLFLYESGARVTAALNVKPADVSLTDGQCLLSVDVAKTNIEQVFYMSPSLVEALRKVLDKTADRLFPWPYCRETLWAHHREIMEQAGLQPERHVGFHRIRKTNATQMVIAAGWEQARVALGHSKESMTHRYVDLRQVPRPRISLPVPGVTP